MRAPRVVPALLPALFFQAAAPAPAGATTLVRQGLERLARDNEVIVLGHVVGRILDHLGSR